MGQEVPDGELPGHVRIVELEPRKMVRDLVVPGDKQQFLVVEGQNSEDGFKLLAIEGVTAKIHGAIDNGADLLPVVIFGTFDINPPGSWFVYPGRVVVKILDTVETAEYTFRDITPLTNELHDRLLATYEELRNEPS